ncbi:hypothetical protein GVAMD_0354 [Gardnerella vaginalis AMD]|nr:hypothetical protein GVAMD_0354 [Gardnerella vaginalis AMD]
MHLHTINYNNRLYAQVAVIFDLISNNFVFAISRSLSLE